jgi:hypothetical protein
MNTPSRVRIPGDVVSEQLDGEAVVLNLRTGVYYALNPTGTRIWELLAAHGDPEAVVTSMLAEFEVSPQRLRDDVSVLIGALLERGLVEPVREGA